MKRRFVVSSAEALQHLGLLTAFILLVAARQFSAAHPAMMSIVVFAFSLPYLVAAVVTRRAGFLYATMLLGAVSYFYGCNALGAPGTFFPLLSVPLVICLLIVGHCLRLRLDAKLTAFPRTVFRAMHITVAVFATWALTQVGGLLGQPGFVRYVAGLAFLGYAALYLTHRRAGARGIYTYAFAAFLTLGGVFTVAAVAPIDFCWIPAIASAAVILAVGTKLHGEKKYKWSRHFYLSSGAVIAVSLALSLVRPSFLMVDLALGAMLLWAAYGWMAKSVPDVRRAMLADRVVAKCFFFGAMFLSAIVAPMTLLWPTDPYLICSALICGLMFWWVTWSRRDQVLGARSIYVLAAAMFTSAGVLGAGRFLPGWFAQGWSFVGLVVLLGALSQLHAPLQKVKNPTFGPSSGVAAVFPVFFAWFIPLSQGELAVALGASLLGGGGVAVLAYVLKEKRYLYGVGAALAGAFVAGALLLVGKGLAAWIACAVAAAGAGACFLWADAWSRRVTRAAANHAWLILSIATVVVAGAAGAPQSLWGVTTVGSTSVLMSGLRKRRGKQDG